MVFDKGDEVDSVRDTLVTVSNIVDCVKSAVKDREN